MWVPKVFLPPQNVGIFGPNNSQIRPKVGIFGHFKPNIGLSGPFGAIPDQETM